MLLGCIADDFTGATDLANTLVRQGMRTVQLIGVPDAGATAADADAVVVALKSRTTPVSDAIDESLAALSWLQAAGCEQFLFKYCSTFDSTAAGNIGQVSEALQDALGTPFSIACPAFPENGRTIFKGYLFAGDVLLNESGMQNHPLTPMTDANLVRVLDAQTMGDVGLVDYATVASGPGAVADAFDRLRAGGARHAIVDAVSDADLVTIGRACAGLPLITGGSGIALGLPGNFRDSGRLAEHANAAAVPDVGGYRAVLSGSCSRATLAQVDAMAATRPAFRIDPLQLAENAPLVDEALEWATPLLPDGPPLIYASADPEAVQAAQARLGRDAAGALVEQALAAIAVGLRARGVRALVVAGGETSGAVVSALGVKALAIGPQIAPGVPWTSTLEDAPLALALKSGNFGGVNFFDDAFEQLGVRSGNDQRV